MQAAINKLSINTAWKCMGFIPEKNGGLESSASRRKQTEIQQGMEFGPFMKRISLFMSL